MWRVRVSTVYNNRVERGSLWSRSGSREDFVQDFMFMARPRTDAAEAATRAWLSNICRRVSLFCASRARPRPGFSFSCRRSRAGEADAASPSEVLWARDPDGEGGRLL